VGVEKLRVFLQTVVGVQKFVFFFSRNGVGVQKLRVNFASWCGCGSKTETTTLLGCLQLLGTKSLKRDMLC
jgi:hypothetical protein